MQGFIESHLIYVNPLINNPFIMLEFMQRLMVKKQKNKKEEHEDLTWFD